MASWFSAPTARPWRSLRRPWIRPRAAFAGTPFYARIAQAYGEGAGLLLCADLSRMAQHGAPAGARYFVAEQKEVNHQMEARATLGFDGARSGPAGWLASSGPHGVAGLCFARSFRRGRLRSAPSRGHYRPARRRGAENAGSKWAPRSRQWKRTWTPAWAANSRWPWMDRWCRCRRGSWSSKSTTRRGPRAPSSAWCRITTTIPRRP